MPEQELVMESILEGIKSEPLTRLAHCEYVVYRHIELRMYVRVSVGHALHYQVSQLAVFEGLDLA